MDSDWFKDGVFYNIDVRSFYDGDGDGIGDLQGLRKKLDYLQELGVTAILLESSALLEAPASTHGGGTSDARPKGAANVSACKELLRDAHDRGVRVITELLVSGISDGGAVDIDHPRVRRTVLKAMRNWFDAGIDALKLDGIPNLIEGERSSHAPPPENHLLMTEMREVIDHEYANRALLVATDRAPADVAAYFGDGDECHMVFNTSLMPGLLASLQQEDRRLLLQALRRVPEIPRSCQWAHVLGDGKRLAPLCDHDRRRIELAWGLVSSLPGAPVINFGDEIGMGGAVVPGSRNGSRGPMQWSPYRNGGFSRVDSVRLYAPVDSSPDSGYHVVNVDTQERRASSLLNCVRRLIAVRGQHRALRRGSIEFLETQNQAVLTYLRRNGDERVLVIANLSGKAQSVDVLLSLYAGTQPVELIGGATFRVIGAGPYPLALAPYGFYWLMLNRRAARVSSSRVGAAGALTNGTDAMEARRYRPESRKWESATEGGMNGTLPPSSEPQTIDVAVIHSSSGPDASDCVPPGHCLSRARLRHLCKIGLDRGSGWFRPDRSGGL